MKMDLKKKELNGISPGQRPVKTPFALNLLRVSCEFLYVCK